MIWRNILLVLFSFWPIKLFVYYFFARRFVAGQTLEDALKTAKRLNNEGFVPIINFLGEEVEVKEDTREMVSTYLTILWEIKQKKIPARLAIKPSRLGIHINSRLYWKNLTQVARLALRLGVMLEIDMEDFIYSDKIVKMTIALKTRLPNLRLRQAVPLRFKRNSKYIEELLKTEVGIRLCGGEYEIPESLSLSQKELKEEFISCGLRYRGADIEYATHDLDVLEKLPPDSPMQFSLGLRKKLMEELIKNGRKIAIHIPFGTDWKNYGIKQLIRRRI